MAKALFRTHRDREAVVFNGPLGQKVTLIGNLEKEVQVEDAHWLARTGGVEVTYDSKEEQDLATALTAEESVILLKPAFTYELPGPNANVNSVLLGYINEPVYILTAPQLTELINLHVAKVVKVPEFELVATPVTEDVKEPVTDDVKPVEKPAKSGKKKKDNTPEEGDEF